MKIKKHKTKIKNINSLELFNNNSFFVSNSSPSQFKSLFFPTLARGLGNSFLKSSACFLRSKKCERSETERTRFTLSVPQYNCWLGKKRKLHRFSQTVGAVFQILFFEFVVHGAPTNRDIPRTTKSS